MSVKGHYRVGRDGESVWVGPARDELVYWFELGVKEGLRRAQGEKRDERPRSQ